MDCLNGRQTMRWKITDCFSFHVSNEDVRKFTVCIVGKCCDTHTVKAILHYSFRTYALSVGWHSVAHITTRYGLDGWGIESRRGDFSAPVQTGSGVYPTTCRLSTGSLPGAMQPGRGLDHSLPSGAEVKEWIDMYLYSFSVPSRHDIGWTSLCTCLQGSDARKNNRRSCKNFWCVEL